MCLKNSVRISPDQHSMIPLLIASNDHKELLESLVYVVVVVVLLNCCT